MENCNYCKYMDGWCRFTDETGEICEGKNGYEPETPEDKEDKEYE